MVSLDTSHESSDTIVNIDIVAQRLSRLCPISQTSPLGTYYDEGS